MLHKKLTETMEMFTSDLEADLEIMRGKMANNEQIVDSHFERMSSQVDHWASKFQGNFESVSVDVEVSCRSPI